MADNRVILKKSSVASKVPTSSDLVYGELAVNYTDGRIYFKNSSNNIEFFEQVNSFQNIDVSGQTTLTADGGSDTLTFVEGNGISITTDDATNELTITASGSAGNDFVDTASFDTTNGELILTRTDNGTIVVDLDGRYLQSYTETDRHDPVTARGNTTTNSLDIGGHTASADLTVNGLTVGRGATSSFYPSNNTAFGVNALSSNTTGLNNLAIGSDVLGLNTEGDDNTAIGEKALQENIDGFRNTAVGYQALQNNTTGHSNDAFGRMSMRENTSGTYNLAIGGGALFNNISGSRNTAAGSGTLSSNTTGLNNVAIGYNSLKDNTDGRYNVAVGTEAMNANTLGERNVAVGHYALDENTDGDQNVAVGDASLGSNTSGNHNTAVGHLSLVSNTTLNHNTAYGYRSLQNTDSGFGNTVVGSQAGQLITTGSKNTIVGRFNGSENGLDIRTSDNYIVLSDGDGNPRQVIDGSGNVGIGITAPSSKLDVDGTVTATAFSGNLDYNDITNSPTIGNGTLTISGGSGLTGSGTFGANQSTNETITINHANTSSQGDVNNSGGTVIQDINVDTYGHITSIGSKSLSASDIGALSTSGKAADSNLLDGLNSSQFLRSDTSDTFTTLSGTELNIGPESTYSGNTTTLSTTSQSEITSFSATTFGGGKLLIQITRGSERQISEILLTHDGTNAFATEYGVVYTGSAPLAEFDVDISGGNIRLLATGSSSTSTEYKVTEILTVA